MVVPVLMTNCQVSLKPNKRTGHYPRQDDRHGKDKNSWAAAEMRGLSRKLRIPSAASIVDLDCGLQR